jgi:hypothetical protein
MLAGRQTEGMNEASERHVRGDGPTQFDDLLGGEVLLHVVEHLTVDVLVVDEETFGVAQGGLFAGREVGVGPLLDLADDLFLKTVSP